MKRPRTVLTLVVLAAVVILAAAYFVLPRLLGVETLTTIEKRSPDRKHVARLRTIEGGLDVNVILEVDGKHVYGSPDFAAPAHVDFQERLVWDRTGKIVLVELAGKRVFGYHVAQQRPLRVNELSIVQLAPFSELRLAVDIPGIAHASP
jgi:hypothetical protein